MDAYTRTLRFNHNPLNLILGAEKKKGLRIGYMEAGLQGFYLNSIETGIHPQKLSKLLTEEFHCTDNESATGLFQFLIVQTGIIISSTGLVGDISRQCHLTW